MKWVGEQHKHGHSTAITARHILQNFIQWPCDIISRLLGKTLQAHQFTLEVLVC